MKGSTRVPLTVEEFCPIRHTIRLLGKQWTMLVLFELHMGKRRTLNFMELSRRLKGASSKVLSERLKEMAENGLVRRRVDDTVKSPRVRYSLTKKGQEACQMLEGFKEYGVRWAGKETFDCTRIECELCRKDKAEPA